MNITVTTASPEDARSLAPRLRDIDLQELAASSGSSPLDILLHGAEFSTLGMSVRVDGQVEAMFGVVPYPEDENAGIVWLLASDEFFAVGPVRLLRQSRIWLERMHRHFPILFNLTLTSNEAAINYLAYLGFNFTVLHPFYGITERPFLQFERQATDV
ncbi:hypothetical protein N8077_04330 [Myxococcota bacterium]|nr:hypothetical protein [Myxococcota bacterium]